MFRVNYGVLTMKMIAVIPVALLTLGVLGCSQQASTASTPAVQHPAGAGSSDTNTFGENKEDATGSAASAREANYGGQAPAADPTAPSSNSTAESAPPK